MSEKQFQQELQGRWPHMQHLEKPAPAPADGEKCQHLWTSTTCADPMCRLCGMVAKPAPAPVRKEDIAEAHQYLKDYVARKRGTDEQYKHLNEAITILLRAIEPAPSSSGDLAGWQPIETAPKDGTEILAVGGDDFYVTGWCIMLNEWDIDERDSQPTHWQPLPPPPTTRKEKP